MSVTFRKSLILMFPIGFLLITHVYAETRDRSKPDKKNNIQQLLRVLSPDGVFSVHHAIIQPDNPRQFPGHLAFWKDSITNEIHVYGRLLYSITDVGHALLNLEPDLSIDPVTVIMGNPTLRRALSKASIP